MLRATMTSEQAAAMIEDLGWNPDAMVDLIEKGYIVKSSEILISPDLEENLNRIYNYFGGRENKLQKLFEEAGEYRDRYILNGQSVVLRPDMLTEIVDIGSCFLQLYFNEPLVREKLEYVVNKAIRKIEEGYYENI